MENNETSMGSYNILESSKTVRLNKESSDIFLFATYCNMLLGNLNLAYSCNYKQMFILNNLINILFSNHYIWLWVELRVELWRCEHWTGRRNRSGSIHMCKCSRQWSLCLNWLTQISSLSFLCAYSECFHLLRMWFCKRFSQYDPQWVVCTKNN